MKHKLIKTAIAIILIVIIGLLLQASIKDGFFTPFFKDSRIHSLDLEELRTDPRLR